MNFDAITGIFAGIPYDWIGLGLFALFLAFDSLRNGIGRACALSLALPIALFFHTIIDRTIVLKDLPMLDAQGMPAAGIFLGIVLVTYFLVRRMGVEHMESGIGEPIQSLFAAAAATAVLIVVYLQSPFMEAWGLSGVLQQFFAEGYRLFWLVGAYAMLAFARG